MKSKIKALPMMLLGLCLLITHNYSCARESGKCEKQLTRLDRFKMDLAQSLVDDEVVRKGQRGCTNAVSFCCQPANFCGG